MQFCIALVILLSTTLALGMPPSVFVGMWQTRTSRGTIRPAITVVIVELQQRLGGAVVLADSHAGERKLPILNVEINENVVEFETPDQTGTCYWSLTLQQNHARGRLRGRCGEMLGVDEPVRKLSRTPQ